MPLKGFKILEYGLIHARIAIVDENEAIISSADLTQEGLICKYNAGIYFRDSIVIKDAIAFFDNL